MTDNYTLKMIFINDISLRSGDIVILSYKPPSNVIIQRTNDYYIKNNLLISGIVMLTYHVGNSDHVFVE